MNEIGNQEASPGIARSRVGYNERVVGIDGKVSLRLVGAQQIGGHNFQTVNHSNARPLFSVFTGSSRPVLPTRESCFGGQAPGARPEPRLTDVNIRNA